MTFDVVVAADREWGIGKANALPWPKLKGDLAHFKKITCEASEGRRNALGMTERDTLRHQLAQNQGEIGDADHYHRHADDMGVAGKEAALLGQVVGDVGVDA